MAKDYGWDSEADMLRDIISQIDTLANEKWPNQLQRIRTLIDHHKEAGNIKFHEDGGRDER